MTEETVFESNSTFRNPEPELEAKPTTAGVIAAELVLQDIYGRSFSERHPELGKMRTCPHCHTRNRENVHICTQKFATGRYDLRDPKPLLIAGETPETEPFPHHTKIKIVLGRVAFQKKRHNPHHNYRALQFIEMVRILTPDEYTQEDLKKARVRAKRILAEKFGRHGFLPAIKKSQPKPTNDI